MLRHAQSLSIHNRGRELDPQTDPRERVGEHALIFVKSMFLREPWSVNKLDGLFHSPTSPT
jgi:hypothetical protein